jgi:hypothetical protein
VAACARVPPAPRCGWVVGRGVACNIIEAPWLVNGGHGASLSGRTDHGWPALLVFGARRLSRMRQAENWRLGALQSQDIELARQLSALRHGEAFLLQQAGPAPPHTRRTAPRSTDKAAPRSTDKARGPAQAGSRSMADFLRAWSTHVTCRASMLSDGAADMGGALPRVTRGGPCCLRYIICLIDPARLCGRSAPCALSRPSAGRCALRLSSVGTFASPAAQAAQAAVSAVDGYRFMQAAPSAAPPSTAAHARAQAAAAAAHPSESDRPTAPSDSISAGSWSPASLNSSFASLLPTSSVASIEFNAIATGQGGASTPGAQVRWPLRPFWRPL